MSCKCDWPLQSLLAGTNNSRLRMMLTQYFLDFRKYFLPFALKPAGTYLMQLSCLYPAP